jgi:hypothetical protein
VAARQQQGTGAYPPMALSGDLGEPKLAFVELKQDVGTKKVQIVLDSAAVTPLIVWFLGVLVGVIVVLLWK